MARPKKAKAAPKAKDHIAEVSSEPADEGREAESPFDPDLIHVGSFGPGETDPPPALIEDLIVEAPSGFTIIREPHSWKVVRPVGGGHPRYGIGPTLREALADAGLR